MRGARQAVLWLVVPWSFGGCGPLDEGLPPGGQVQGDRRQDGASGPPGVNDPRDAAVDVGLWPVPNGGGGGAGWLASPPRPDAATTITIAGPPEQMGCSDGSREGFLDPGPRGWPRIAGCSGAWQRPGLMPNDAYAPRCERNSGNTSANPKGLGCSASDLCAAGWHICLGAGEVDQLSPSGCESAVPYGAVALFAVAGGGSQTGDCAFGQALANDVRGCGTLGQPEAEGCHPLDRRLEFGDCLETSGVWKCGSPAEHLKEVEHVLKSDAALGGVLCCRDAI